MRHLFHCYSKSSPSRQCCSESLGHSPRGFYVRDVDRLTTEPSRRELTCSLSLVGLPQLNVAAPCPISAASSSARDFQGITRAAWTAAGEFDFLLALVCHTDGRCPHQLLLSSVHNASSLFCDLSLLCFLVCSLLKSSYHILFFLSITKLLLSDRFTVGP